MADSLKELAQQIQIQHQEQDVQFYENYFLFDEIHKTLVDIRDSFNGFIQEYKESQLAQLEQSREDARQDGMLDPTGPAPTTQDTPASEQAEGLSAGPIGITASIAALSKIFEFDEFLRIPAIAVVLEDKVSMVSKSISSFSTTVTKSFDSFGRVGQNLVNSFSAGTKSFNNVARGADGSFRSLNVFEKFFNTLGRITTAVKSFLAPLGKLLAPLGSLFRKIALPITIIFAVLDGIEGFTKEFAESGSIISGIREAVVSIVDGFAGSIVRFLGDSIDFILSLIGLDQLGETVSEFTDSFVNSILNVFRGALDVVLGVFTLDASRIGDGFSNIFSGFVDTILDTLAFTIDSVTSLINDIFGFEIPSIKDFDFNAIMRSLLPEPDSFLAKFIPDSVYESVGVNPETGELIQTEPQETRSQISIVQERAERRVDAMRNSATNETSNAPETLLNPTSLVQESAVDNRFNVQESAVDDRISIRESAVDNRFNVQESAVDDRISIRESAVDDIINVRESVTDNSFNVRESVTDNIINVRESVVDDIIKVQKSVVDDRINVRESAVDDRINVRESAVDDRISMRESVTDNRFNVQESVTDNRFNVQESVVSGLPINATTTIANQESSISDSVKSSVNNVINATVQSILSGSSNPVDVAKETVSRSVEDIRNEQTMGIFNQLPDAVKDIVTGTPVDVFNTITRSENKVLNSPVNQMSSEVATASQTANVLAPVLNTISPITNNSNVTSISKKTVITSPSARATDPTFRRIQDKLGW